MLIQIHALVFHITTITDQVLALLAKTCVLYALNLRALSVLITLRSLMMEVVGALMGSILNLGPVLLVSLAVQIV